MKFFNFYYENALLSEQEIEKHSARVKQEIDVINKEIEQGYSSHYAPLSVVFDQQLQNNVKALVEKKMELSPDIFVVIGIGGSNLGTMAVHNALHGALYNQLTKGCKVYFADNVDPDYIHSLLELTRDGLKNGKKVLLNVVTKSGTTTETIANFELFLDLLKRYHPDDFQKYVVITTDKGSRLMDFADSEGLDSLEVPKKVGGRFSVFSPVGLFPLSILGIDIDRLIKGAHDSLKKCLQKDIFVNPAALSATIKYIYYTKNIHINDTFIFSEDLYSLGKWYRQLVGESLGKEYNIHNEKVEVGITPTVSLGTVDLHSVAQLYLGGPRDKFTTFMTLEKMNMYVQLPRIPKFENMVENIQGKSLNVMYDAIFQGVQIAYKNDKRPYVHIKLQEKNPESIGQYMQYAMMEIIYLGSLLEINAFNQPHVEKYKKETRKILAHE